jgi:hypothetical protein
MVEITAIVYGKTNFGIAPRELPVYRINYFAAWIPGSFGASLFGFALPIHSLLN